MLGVLRTTWPLLLGVMLLMVGNGMQSTLLGIRGGIEGIGTQQMAWVMSSYYGGFLAGSLIVPRLIRGVGHVRVFAALGSMISAILVLYPSAPLWPIWAALRLAIGFSFVGVYITAESWLNASAANAQRGQAMSAYMIVQMLGIVAAQVLVNVGDPAGFVPFVIPSVLVSLAFMPILLSRQPAPQFGNLRRMSLPRLWRISPLGCVGVFLMGGVFSALFGMAPVWGSEAGLNVREITSLVASVYIGGLVLQWPVGRLSDRGDRRALIAWLSVAGAAAVLAYLVLQPGIWGLLAIAALVGGAANPLYSLLIAHANDQIGPADMPAVSAGLLFINGVGSVAGPLLTGWLMTLIGLDGFWIYIGVLLAFQAGYAAWRRRGREAPVPGVFAPLAPTAGPVAVEAALDETVGPQPPAPADPRDDLPRGALSMPAQPDDVLQFWLHETPQANWYRSTPELDAAIAARFGPALDDAAALTEGWAKTAQGALAGVILTDQFPRNMFRGTARAFATDPLALKLARAAVEADHDLATPLPQRQFFYLPFEHSENAADQDRAVALFEERAPELEENLRHAKLHRDVIAAFGRFPDRNAALGRENTPAEAAFLAAGGYAGLAAGKASLPA